VVPPINHPYILITTLLHPMILQGTHTHIIVCLLNSPQMFPTHQRLGGRVCISITACPPLDQFQVTTYQLGISITERHTLQARHHFQPGRILHQDPRPHI
jgi:hypothetical protein